MKSLESLLALAEEQDWIVRPEEEGGRVLSYELEKYTPEGQDFIVILQFERKEEKPTPALLIDALKRYIESYDPSEETSIWLDNTGHGKNGAPYEVIDIYNDMVAAKNMMQQLLNEWEGKRPDLLVCSECGSTRVQRQAWVNANTHEYVDDTDPDGDNEGDNWCEECEEHTAFCRISEFEEMMDEWARGKGLAWAENATYEQKRKTYNNYKKA